MEYILNDWGSPCMPELFDLLNQSLLCVPKSSVGPEKENDGLVSNLCEQPLQGTHTGG